MTKEETESFLREAQIARFCSINKDGSIHAAPVSYKYESGQIIVMTPQARSNVRNVKRNKKQSGTKVFLSGLLSRSASNGSLRSDQVRLV
jgi:nitroimidazol reductase NimA-like FMN-containing flavoprotein (pyridoxamine 5'-phosphate oxidase superfamily)